MKEKIKKVFPLLSLLAIPFLVLADDFSDVGPIQTLMMHLMLSLHSAGFFCLPISLIFGNDKVSQKKVFWKVFWIRTIVVVILSFIIPGVSIIIDFASVFIGAFIGLPLSAVISYKKGGSVKTMTNTTVIQNNKCTNCGAVIVSGNSFCTSCGQKVSLTVASAPTKSNVLSLPSGSQGTAFGAAKIFGYNMTEEQMVEEIIKKEIVKTGENDNVSVAGVEKRKNIFTFIYAIILMICVSLFFFHSHTVILIVVFIVVTIIYFNSIKNYNLLKYLQKEVKARPDEKISYIVSTVLSGKVSNGSSKAVRLAIMLFAIVVPLFVFRAPYVIYEKDTTLNGYVIRFYTIGWLENDTKLEIPAEYKGEPVVGIRGDVFANVYTLQEVILPETIKEIRGSAFKNAINLEKINLPDGIPEIKGNTFEGCNLKEITIPDSVTRIGGHAFRNNQSLAKVNISSKSQLKEIGSSAFRDCYELRKIYLPRNVNINERAFKGSGTNVKEYNEDGIILGEEYEFEKPIFLDDISKSDTVYSSYNNSIIKDGVVTLKEVKGEYGNYSFVLEFQSEGNVGVITLSRTNNSFKINDNLMIIIESDYVFEYYEDRVSLVSYYN